MINFFKTKYPALIIYFASAIITSIGLIFKLEYLFFLTKPIIVPSAMYYYLQRVKLKVDWMFVLAIVISFISDMFVLIDPSSNLTVVLLNLFVYFIFINFLLNDFFDSKGKKNKMYEFVIILMGFLFLVYLIMDLLQNIDRTTYYIYTFYGVVLSFLSTIAVFLNLRKQNNRTFNGLFMAVCFIITDIFYALYNYQLKLEVFLIINLIAQVFSYYYMIGYITAKKA